MATTTNSSPPDAADDVGMAEGLAQNHAGAHQDEVAGAVAELVIDFLQSVQVYVDDDERPVRPPGQAHVLFGQGKQTAPVINAGQLVQQRESWRKVSREWWRSTA